MTVNFRLPLRLLRGGALVARVFGPGVAFGAGVGVCVVCAAAFACAFGAAFGAGSGSLLAAFIWSKPSCLSLFNGFTALRF